MYDSEWVDEEDHVTGKERSQCFPLFVDHLVNEDVEHVPTDLRLKVSLNTFWCDDAENKCLNL